MATPPPDLPPLNKTEYFSPFSTSQYNKVCGLFAEDPSRLPPEQFFGLFREFLDTFASSRKDNIAERKRKDDEEKRKKMEQEVSAIARGARKCQTRERGFVCIFFSYRRCIEQLSHSPAKYVAMCHVGLAPENVCWA